MTHTPAPWAFDPSSCGYGFDTLWNPNTREEIVSPNGQNNSDCPITWMGEDLTDANKALIEAAPVLLPALTNLLSAVKELIENSHSASSFLDISVLLASAMDDADKAITLTTGASA